MLLVPSNEETHDRTFPNGKRVRNNLVAAVKLIKNERRCKLFLKSRAEIARVIIFHRVVVNNLYAFSRISERLLIDVIVIIARIPYTLAFEVYIYSYVQYWSLKLGQLEEI